MAKSLTMTELKSMTVQDLGREIRGKRIEIGSLRLTISLGKEKNTAFHKKAKKELARLLTVWSEKATVRPRS